MLDESNGRVAWFQQPGQKNYTVIAELPGEQICFLDYYDSELEAAMAARHFAICVGLANMEGFELIPGFFIHPAGYGVTVAEALVLDESPEKFRRVLRQLKAGVYKPRVNKMSL